MDTIASSSPHLNAKLVWNSAVDSEDSFDVQMALYKTSLVKNSLHHVFSEAQSSKRLVSYPVLAAANRAAQESYDKKYSLWEKSLKSLNDETNKAMGLLMDILAPDCNAYRLIATWMDEDVTSMLPIQDQNRVDVNFRHMWAKFCGIYEPNKEVNLDSILKKWEALTDEHMSFSEFHGKHVKYIQEMEAIGQPPTEARQLEVLRQNVKNPYLNFLRAQLCIGEGRRISIEDFFYDCNIYTRINREHDTGRKRTIESVVGFSSIAQNVPKKSRVTGGSMSCFRCGDPAHTLRNCTATKCTLCHQTIADKKHDTRNCILTDIPRFSAGVRSTPNSSPKAAKKKSNGSKSKKNSLPSTSSGGDSSRATSLPKDVQAAYDLVRNYETKVSTSSNVQSRKVAFSADHSSSKN